MATPVALPSLGESVTEGTVTRWLKQVGDSVAVDEPLVEVSTDKVDTEIPSPVSGTLLEIKAAEDETVEIGAVLALIGEVDAAPSAAAAAPSGPATAPSPAVAAEPAPGSPSWAPVNDDSPGHPSLGGSPVTLRKRHAEATVPETR
jgi:pyruvate dehydrogenase E2 component (dihydrolipoamide acetyltransferase)